MSEVFLDGGTSVRYRISPLRSNTGVEIIAYQVDGKTKLPIISVLTTTIFCVLLALISIGSDVAFNDAVSLTLAALYASYFIACALLLWRRTTGSIKLPDEVDQKDVEGYNLPGSAGNLVWGPWRV